MKWVVQTLEDCVHLEDSRKFIKTSSLGNNAFIAQRSNNIHGCYLTIVECRGGGNRDDIIISEEANRKSWRKMAMELHVM